MAAHDPPASPSAPPECGRRLLMNVIEEKAQQWHTRPLFSIPRTNKAQDGYRDIFYWEFANAINRCARWLKEHIGISSKFESITYIGPSDLRYQILMMAAVKTGYVMFLPSPRNSDEAFDSLLESCNASILVTSSTPMPVVSKILSRRPHMQQLHLPELEALLDPSLVETVPYTKTFEQGRFEPFVQIHTSGSTGIPKLITLKHGNFCCIDACQSCNPNEMAQRVGDARLMANFPPFHAAGLLYTFVIPVWANSTAVLPPSGLLTADIVNDVHVHGSVDVSSLPPSIVVDLVKNEQYLENLRQLRCVTYAGGPLPEATGSLVAQKTMLGTNIGTTEYLAVALLPKELEDWPYFKFNEAAIGMEFRERDEGLYEMVFVKRPELDLIQGIFVTFPNLSEYNTKDLFAKGPKPGLWKYVSRLDDIMVLSNGENVNPVTMEGAMTSCKDVKGCVIVGQGRFQPICLIEPADPAADKAELLERVWLYIQKANTAAVRHGRIAKDVVFFTSPEKPFPRTGKGTIQRAAANALYAPEIEEIYRNLEDVKPTTSKESSKFDLRDIATTKATLAKLVRDDLDVQDFGLDDDLFSAGMDSLQSINLLRAINATRADNSIETKGIYDHPTVNKLATFLHDGSSATLHDGYDSDDENEKDAWLAMDGLYNDFVAQHGHTKRTPKKLLQSANSGPVFQPDGGVTSWLQVLASFLININNWGLINTFGVFQAYYQTNMLQSYSSSSISWVGTLQGALLLMVGVVSGPLFDAGYFRVIQVIGSLGVVFATMMLSLSTKYYQIILTQGVLMGICSGLLYIPSIALIPVYFKRKRGLALGLALGGGSIGGVIYPIVFRRLLISQGFPRATRIIGFNELGTLAIAIAIAKPIGPRTRRQLIDSAALKDVPYVAQMVAAFLLFAAILVPFFLGPTFAADKLHTGSDTAFYILAILNGAQFFGRLLPSWYCDSHPLLFGPEGLFWLAEFGAGVLGFTWVAVHNLGGFIPWAILYGFLSGILATLPAIVLPHICPSLAIYGTRLGMVYACAGVGFLISTPIAAAADGNSRGHFLGAQIWTGACSFGALAFFSVTAWEARKRRLLYENGRRARGRRSMP